MKAPGAVGCIYPLCLMGMRSRVQFLLCPIHALSEVLGLRFAVNYFYTFLQVATVQCWMADIRVAHETSRGGK